MEKKLTRSFNQKMLAGVCGGIAEYFGWDVTIVRVVFVLGIFLGLSTLALYVVLLLLMPQS
jgi:phage shock protein C